MNDNGRYQIMNELVQALGALQSAYAYAQHAEEIARGENEKGLGMRIGGLRRQINLTADHAAIIRESLKR